MGILIKAPTRRREARTLAAVDAQDDSGDTRGCAAHPRSGPHHRACAASSCTCGSAATAFRRRCATRSAIASIRPTRSRASSSSSSCCPKAGAPARSCRSPTTALQSMLGLAVDEPTPLPAEIETAVTLLVAAPRRRAAEPPVQAAGRPGAAQVPRADADPAERGRARARGARRDAELPGAALRRSRAATAARRDAPRPRRRAMRGRSCSRRRPTIPTSSASRFSSCCCSRKASTA